MIRTLAITLLVLPALLTARPALGHPADEVRQVSLEVSIDDDAVVQHVRLPLSYALNTIFNGLPLARYRELAPGEAELLLAQAMAEHNPVVIDGVTVLPIIRNPRVEGFTPDQPTAALPGAYLLMAGALAFEASYATLGQPPQTVSLTWRMIVPERAAAATSPTAPAGAEADNPGLVTATIAAQGKAQLAVFSATEPEHIWHNTMQLNPVSLQIAPAPAPTGYRVPVLAMVVVFVAGVATFFIRAVRVSVLVLCAGIGLSLIFTLTQVGSIHIQREPTPPPIPEAERAREIFTVLHRNIYRAFDYTDESAIYDALAQSVEGAELAVIYNDVYQSLILRDQGGAVCKVQDVRIDKAQVLDEPIAGEPAGYKVRCTWEVDGLVQHHGHTHARTNRFSAIYTLAPRQGEWRIIATDIIEQQRTDDGNQTLEDLFNLPPPPEVQDTPEVGNPPEVGNAANDSDGGRGED